VFYNNVDNVRYYLNYLTQGHLTSSQFTCILCSLNFHKRTYGKPSSIKLKEKSDVARLLKLKNSVLNSSEFAVEKYGEKVRSMQTRLNKMMKEDERFNSLLSLTYSISTFYIVILVKMTFSSKFFEVLIEKNYLAIFQSNWFLQVVLFKENLDEIV